jgi:hypothetical protein
MIKTVPGDPEWGCDEQGIVYDMRINPPVIFPPSLGGGDGKCGYKYKFINIPKIRNNPRRIGYVHVLVAKTWLATPLPHRDKVDHIDGDSMNNNAWNLEWVTLSENGENNSNLQIKALASGSYQVSVAGPNLKPKISRKVKTYAEAIDLRINLVLKYKTHNPINRMYNDMKTLGKFTMIQKAVNGRYNIQQSDVAELIAGLLRLP